MPGDDHLFACFGLLRLLRQMQVTDVGTVMLEGRIGSSYAACAPGRRVVG